MFRSPRRLRWRVSAALIMLLALAHSPPSWSPGCTPSFPYKDGWLGGDDAYSVPLDAHRSVWLLADSFAGDATQRTRAGSHMIANSIAISSCSEGNFNISYYIPRSKSGAARAFFDSKTNAYRMWPLDGFIARGTLYVALVQIVTRAAGGPFDFEMTGVKLARIPNSHDDPRQWEIDYLPLTAGKVAFPGVAAIVQEPWVYLFTVLADAGHPKHPMILARIELDGLDRPEQSLEYLAKDGRWKRGLNWSDARIIIDEGHTEMSVRYHPDIHKWIAVQQQPGLGSGAGVRVADHLDGPWSSFATSVLEPTPDRDPLTFCYAAKEHIEFASRAGELAMTCVCSSLDFGKLTANMSLYRPQFLRRLVVHLQTGSQG